MSKTQARLVLLEQDTIEHKGITLYRIQATRRFTDIAGNVITAGTLGGYVAHAGNISARSSHRCWIDEDVRVYGNAQISDNARITGQTEVFEDAFIGGNVQISNAYAPNDHTQVYGQTELGGEVRTYGNVKFYGKAQLDGTLFLTGNVRVRDIRLFGQAGNGWITARYRDLSAEEYAANNWRLHGAPNDDKLICFNPKPIAMTHYGSESHDELTAAQFAGAPETWPVHFRRAVDYHILVIGEIDRDPIFFSTAKGREYFIECGKLLSAHPDEEADELVWNWDEYFRLTSYCSHCGYQVPKENLKLCTNDFHWNCPSCGTRLHREENVLKNIKHEAEQGMVRT